MRIKKTIAYLLLAMLFVNSGGLIVYYQISRIQIAMEMERQIRNNPANCETFQFSLCDFKCLDGDASEFRYNGKRFDVIKTVTYSDSILVYCLRDIDEERLVADFSEKLKKTDHSPDSGHMPGKIMKLLRADFLAFNKFEFRDIQNDSVLKYCEIAQLTLTQVGEVLSPPPRLV